ncbi:MAG: alpha/beta hydrolase [Nitriliruptorales bacterium]|nr:alpha/beta hydrolase [Nitriliruptorales bacterium]
MSAEPSEQVDWDAVGRRVGTALDWVFAGLRGVVMAALALVRGTVRLTSGSIRWVRDHREESAAVARRARGPALSAASVAAGAAAGGVAERALLRSTPAAPFEADPTPYGQPALIHGPDGRLLVHRHGSVDQPTVVLVHGWSNTHVVWHKQVQRLRDRFHVVTYDQPGHGTSDPPREWSVHALGRALRAVIESTGADRVTVVGHSLGGAAILDLLGEDPGFFIEHVTGVVFVGSAASFTDRDIAAGPLARLERRVHLGGRLIRLRGLGPIAALSRRSSDISHLAFRLVAFGRRPDAADVDLTEQLWTDADPEMVSGLARALDRWNGRAAARELPANTAVIHGPRDLVLPVWLGRELADLAGIGDVTVVPGRGHQLHLEAPEEVSETIARIATKGAADGARG